MAASLEQTIPSEYSSRNLLHFLLLTAQLGLLLYVAEVFLIEQTYGFNKLLPVILLGFVVQFWLPREWRTHFFVFLFPVSAVALLGLLPGIVLTLAGLGLFVLCHLPVPVMVRAAILVLVAGFLAVIRAGLIDLGIGRAQLAIQGQTLPILAAMFMFRTAVYLYDLRHEKVPASLSQRLGYFFLFPNVCFPLFPVIDYQTYKRTYFNQASFEIYQKGIDWILRGITHLLLYRIVYHYFVPNPLEVDSFAGVGQYALSSFLLYLRVSGLFHLIIGILCLFGYNLPETHHRYYLSESFTDFWRRINIYWKDFMMKLFYYPIFLRLRHFGMTTAMIAATLITFVITWALHSYQWFWIRGTFPLHPQDMLFWAILAVLVTVNSLYEERFGRKRKSLKGKSALTPRDAFVRSFKTVTVFVGICLLWSFWTSASIGEWTSVMSVALQGTYIEWLAFLLLYSIAIAIGTAIQLFGDRMGAARVAPKASVPKRAVWVGSAAVALLAVATPQINGSLDSRAQDLVATITGDQISARDQEQQVKGYYEDLLGAESSGAMAWSVRLEKPDNWDWNNEDSSAYTVDTGDIRGSMYRPLISGIHKGEQFTTNQWGIRGPDISKAKPPGSYRIAMLGSSYTVGAGVPVDDIFPSRVVQKINRGSSGTGPQTYEYLNLAYGGDSILRRLARLEKQALEFGIDLVLDMAITDEMYLAVRNLRDIARKPSLDVDPYLRDVIRRAGVTPDMSDDQIEHLLRPFGDEVCRWGYSQLAKMAEQYGFDVVVFVLPRTSDTNRSYQKEWRLLSAMSGESGVKFVELGGVYGPFSEVNSIKLAPWDWHPNAAGHERLAERIYQELQGLEFLPFAQVVHDSSVSRADN